MNRLADLLGNSAYVLAALAVGVMFAYAWLN